jgi:hypothetical protein
VEGDFRRRGAHLRCPRGRAAAMGAGAACVVSVPHGAVTRCAGRGEKVGERRLTGWAHMAVRRRGLVVDGLRLRWAVRTRRAGGSAN